MQDFLRVRVAIDSLIDDVKLSIQQKSISDSMEQIGQARQLIQELKQMSTSDQTTIVAKRESTIEGLAVNASKIKKGPTKKKNTKEKFEQPMGFA
jgi:FKBP-type peptidyl-prolyl cis-trans isomerase (trigger factor)